MNTASQLTKEDILDILQKNTFSTKAKDNTNKYKFDENNNKTHKFCNLHQDYELIQNFGICSSSSDGLNGYCKNCCNIYSRVKNLLKKKTNLVQQQKHLFNDTEYNNLIEQYKLTKQKVLDFMKAE